MLKKIGKGLLKFLGGLIALGLVAFIIAYIALNKPLPEGKMGAEADALAEKMLAAVNKDAWDQTNIIQWSFVGMHHFVWDRQRNLVQVEWGDTRVLLNPDNLTGKIYEGGEELPHDQGTIETAYSHFINDAFWMNGYTQIYNGNPERRIVDMEDGTQALLITYTSGGVTPGDSYLWILDETGLPKAWQMWVGIIPIGGIEVTWQDWETLPTGAKIAKNHDAGLANIAITNIKTYQTWNESDAGKDIFAPIVATEF